MEVVDKVKVCRLDELSPYQGRAALIDGEQVALFNIPEHGVFAIQNWDPIGEAYVLCRGIVGDVAGEMCVASPLYKQHFSLKSGECIEKPEIKLSVYKVEIEEGNVLIG
ncbi:nitrite reductase small subunit NirD [Vibrio sp. 16]|uniref:nitrite reductase small subunit NirD n=1 Tax=Vibrio sp. 16 TaxID=391586 RepID=UPI00018F2E81|nr:nitrite reductase small subunit NirD [Vibrio sp. 16]EED27481.1 nitrite reductase (NAD(P)H), small subunit [Vibrio sp. 16]CAK4073744.1 Nitrite reductase (NADH) small subunit [Vibrio sp. 16]